MQQRSLTPRKREKTFTLGQEPHLRTLACAEHLSHLSTGTVTAVLGPDLDTGLRCYIASALI
jgi:hypothetical protein